MARALSLPGVDRFRDAAPFVLRCGIGVIFISHGYLRVANSGGISGFEDFVRFLELPIPAVTAQVVTWLELVGGISLVLGALTRLVSLLFVLEMIGTTAYVKLYKLETGIIGEMGAGAELDVAVGVGALALVLLGPGWAALDRLVGIERRPPALSTPAAAVEPARPSRLQS